MRRLSSLSISLVPCRLFARLFIYCSGGAGRKGYLPTLSTYMLSSGATFAFFMSSPSLPPSSLPSLSPADTPSLRHRTVGTVIRTDGLTMQEWAAQQVREGRAIGLPGVPHQVPAVRERMDKRERL